MAPSPCAKRAAPASSGCNAFGAESARPSAPLFPTCFGLRGQSRCHFLPPQWCQAPNCADHSLSNVLDWTWRFLTCWRKWRCVCVHPVP
eukprot:6193154-Pleurochrysis_carterae.AAC.1